MKFDKFLNQAWSDHAQDSVLDGGLDEEQKGWAKADLEELRKFISLN